LSQLPQAVGKAGIKPPALFVIGPAVSHGEKLDWFGSRPLFGERIVVAAPAPAIVEELEMNGAEVLEVPLPVSPAARIVMEALPITGCVLRSADDADALDEERGGGSWGKDVVAWCLNREASERARQLGWKRVEDVQHTVPEKGIAEGLLRAKAGSRREREG
jgi:hypothetical protein